MILGEDSIRSGRTASFVFPKKLESGGFAPKFRLRGRTGDTPAAKLPPQIEIEIQNGEEQKRGGGPLTGEGQPKRASGQGSDHWGQEKLRRAKKGDGCVPRQMEVRRATDGYRKADREKQNGGDETGPESRPRSIRRSHCDGQAAAGQDSEGEFHLHQVPGRNAEKI